MIHNLTAAPTTGNPTGAALEGQLYMNTTDHKLYFFDGTVWVDTSAQTYTWSITGDSGGSTSVTSGSTVDIAGGEGIVTTNAAGTITVDLDIPSLAAPVGGVVDADSIVVYDASGTVHTEVTLSALKTYINAAAGTFSSFDIAGDTGTDTITDAETITFGGGAGIVTAVTANTVTFTLDFTELTDMTAAIAGTTEFILNNAGDESRKAASEIDLSAFNDDIGIITDQPAIIASGGVPSLFTGITVTEVQQLLDLEVGVDIDAAGTDNSTNVTLVGALDYITISGQVITRNAIVLTTDVSGVLPIANFASIDDDTFATASASTVPTSESVKAYVDSSVTGALVYQGGYNATTDTPSLDDGTPIAGILQGHTYTVTVAGDFFTEAVQVGDMLIAEIDSPTVLADWTTVNKNIPDIVDASTTQKGIVELATIAETNTGTDDTRAVTPDGLDGWTGSAQITTLGTIATGTWQGTSISTTYTDAKVVSVGGTADRITIGGTAGSPTVDIASTYVGQTSITTLGTITTGTWTASVISGTYLANASETAKGVVEEATDAEVAAGTATGATGAKLFVTPAKLSTALGAEGTEGAVVRRLTFNSAASTQTVCAHGFNNLYVVVQVYEVSTGLMVMTEVDVIDVDTVHVNFNTAATASEFKIIVIG